MTRLLSVAALMLLSGCAVVELTLAGFQPSATVITYRPIGYCASLYDDSAPSGPAGAAVLQGETLIFKIVSIENRRSDAIDITSSGFFVEPLPRLPTSLPAQRLTTIPASLVIPAGATLTNPGLVAVPVIARDNPHQFEIVLDVSPTGALEGLYDVRFGSMKLRHEIDASPSARPIVTVNVGRRSLIVNRQTCSVRTVQEWALTR